MPAPENNIVPVLIIGTSVVVVLIAGLFFFVIVYQRKMIKNQVALRRLEDERQQELLKAVISAQESERKRLAEDLHDSVGQVLSAIKLKLHKIDRLSEGQNAMLAETRQLTDECIQEIRNIIHNVLPPVLTDFGLVDALEALCTKMDTNTPIQVTFTRKLTNERFASAVELTLYRIAQELFGNAVKHSEASTIHVELARNGQTLIMSFRDNGIGFNIDSVKHGFGIKNLRSRVQLINGKIDIYSKPLSGTITTINVPLPRG